MNRIWKSIGLGFLLAALLVGTGMAQPTAESETTSVAGTVTQSIDVVAPGQITGWTLDVGSNTYELTSAPTYPQVTASTNYYAASSNLYLKVSDARTPGSGEIVGHMSKTTGGDCLDNAMTVGYAAETAVTLTATPTTIHSTALVETVGTTFTGDVKFNQDVDIDDPAVAYDIVVTFTGTVSA